MTIVLCDGDREIYKYSCAIGNNSVEDIIVWAKHDNNFDVKVYFASEEDVTAYKLRFGV